MNSAYQPTYRTLTLPGISETLDALEGYAEIEGEFEELPPATAEDFAPIEKKRIRRYRMRALEFDELKMEGAGT